MVLKQFHHDFQLAPGVVQTTNRFGKRVYQTPTGKLYPSVTTILGEIPNKGLANWRKRVGADKANVISKNATTRGSGLHKLAETYLRNEPLVFDSPINQSLFNKVRATINNIDNIKLIETGLFSDRMRMAGTPDVIGYYGPRLSTIDFKSSTKIKQEKYIGSYFMQCGAYSMMYEELFKVKPVQAVIIIAVEESNIPQVFKKDTDECVYMFKGYIRNLIEYRKSIPKQ